MQKLISVPQKQIWHYILKKNLYIPVFTDLSEKLIFTKISTVCQAMHLQTFTIAAILNKKLYTENPPTLSFKM